MKLFSCRSDDIPGPFDATRIAHRLADFSERGGRVPEPGTPARRLLEALFGNSPFLGRLVLNDPEFTASLFEMGPDWAMSSLTETLERSAPLLRSSNDLMRDLRRAKSRLALTVSVADISGAWTLNRITTALSKFADLCLTLASAHLLRQRMLAGDLAWPEGVEGSEATPADARLAAASGYIVLAMGKLGARELNYSSDIDLIVLYDREVVRYRGSRDMGDCFIRMTRDLVKLIQERTEDGYVFRVDLRLRPDPGATPVAVSTDGAEYYYQASGLNWERAAMIKARPAAGDIAAGQAFLSRISPFVWRKHLDFAAVADIHAIKTRIHTHHGHQGISVPGHDVKLGPGGIREIEFFTQIQQLISGGRDESLRDPTTLGALDALKAGGYISKDRQIHLSQAYQFLRRVEHRLQMVNDEQTQTMPDAPEDLTHIATFLGYRDRETMEKELLGQLTVVQRYYEDLSVSKIGQGPSPGSPALERGDDPVRIAALGYHDPEKIVAALETWRMGRYRACRTERGRDLLNRLTPHLLAAFAKAADPDMAFARFDEFLSRLPSGVQLFSLFQANPWLLSLISDIMGGAPGLAELLSHNILLLDAVLSDGFFDPPPDRATLETEISAQLEKGSDIEAILDLCRREVAERKFQIGVQVLQGVIDADLAGRAQSDLADAAISSLAPKVEEEFAKRHGVIEGCGMAVLAMGRLGGRELTFTSDIDLIFVYDTHGDRSSNGERPLTAQHYFARLSQRLINAITARTSEGSLYEVDMRLRPSGRAGPVATSIDAFTAYQVSSAWTWEKMALTRARVIHGPEDLRKRAEEAVRKALTERRDADALLLDVAEMRDRLAGEFSTEDPWSVKHIRGGLVDIEFICQHLELKHAADHPEILHTGTAAALKALSDAGLLDRDRAETLVGALHLMATVQGFLRLCFGSGFREEAAAKGMRQALAEATGAKSFDELKRKLLASQKAVRELYSDLIETPAQRLRTERGASDALAGDTP